MRAAGNIAAIVVMGVSGAGKTTVAKLLAKQLNRQLLEGDDFHPASNIDKMSRGVPLDDNDRAPWLRAIASRIDEARRAGRGLVVTCSALKRSYRDMLADGHNDVVFVHLKGGKSLIGQRLKTRAGHFMPATLLDSQFAALQEPSAHENAIIVGIEGTPEAIAADALDKLKVAAAP
jgi:gluconokinase